MADRTQKAISALLNQTLEEYSTRLSIDGGSKILTSGTPIAVSLANATVPIRTPYGPTITIASPTPDKEDPSQVPGGNASTSSLTDLKMDFFTHAVFGVQSEDPKYILQGFKHMLYALQPKGIAIVISLKQGSGKVDAGAGGEGKEGEKFTVGLEDKIKYQSRGKAEKLTDVLEFAGFERGKIRSFEKEVEVDGEKVEAEVVLAMKWDQLTG